MTSFGVQFLLLAVFSLALAAVASGYRDDDPAVVVRGTVRRAITFLVAVAVIGAIALLVDAWLLQPE